MSRTFKTSKLSLLLEIHPQLKLVNIISNIYSCLYLLLHKLSQSLSIQLLKICVIITIVIHLRTVKLVVVDIVFQSKNLMRFGNANKILIKRKQKQGQKQGQEQLHGRVLCIGSRTAQIEKVNL